MRAPADSSGPKVMQPRIMRGFGEVWEGGNNMLLLYFFCFFLWSGRGRGGGGFGGFSEF